MAAARGDYVLLLDSDACPLMDLTEPLGRAFGAEPKLGAVAMQTVAEDGSPTQSSMDVPDALTFLLGPRLDRHWLRLRGTFSQPLVVLFSCALAVRRSAFEQLGGFDTGFDFLDADLDFSMRLSAAGWQTRLDKSLSRCTRAAAARNRSRSVSSATTAIAGVCSKSTERCRRPLR